MYSVDTTKMANDFISIAYAIISGHYDTVLIFLCLHIITFNMSDEKLQDMQDQTKEGGWSEKGFLCLVLKNYVFFLLSKTKILMLEPKKE